MITVPYHSRYERFYCYYDIACCAYLRLVKMRVVVGEEESTGMGGGFVCRGTRRGYWKNRAGGGGEGKRMKK